MSGTDNNQLSGHQPDVVPETETRTPQKKGPRAPNLSTKNTMISQRQERQLTQNDYQSKNEQMTIEKPQVGLNVTAQEFVPFKSRHILSVDAQSFIPKVPELQGASNHYANNYQVEGTPYLDEQFSNLSVKDLGNSETSIIQRFKDVLYTLNYSPASLEEYLQPLCETIEETASSSNVAHSLCEILLEQSIQEENFRYTGARICQFLQNNMTQNIHVTGFAKMFITRCGNEFKRRNELLQGSEEDKKNVCGLAIFMAELFLNVQTKTLDGTTVRFEFMPEKLTTMMKTLLSVPDDMTVKCVCQLLKLVGGLLEDFVKSHPQLCVEFESIFDDLLRLLDSHLTQNIKTLVRSVVELKGKNWNRSLSSSSLNEESVGPSELSYQQEPVFYSNGKECSRAEMNLPYELTDEEELAFLEWQAEEDGPGGEPWSDTGYEAFPYDDFAPDPWMGDDLAAAYEEFLQAQPTYSMVQPRKETSGFARQTTTAAAQPGMYTHPTNEAYPQRYAVDENQSRPPYSQPYYEAGSERMNQMQYQRQPPHPSQPQHHQQQRQQPPYDQSYQHHYPNNSNHPNR